MEKEKAFLFHIGRAEGKRQFRENLEGKRREVEGACLRRPGSTMFKNIELNEGERVWPGFEEETVLISGQAKRREAGLDGNRREVS